MTTYDDTYFEEMAEAAEKGEFTPIPNTLLTGEEARQSALAMLTAVQDNGCVTLAKYVF